MGQSGKSSSTNSIPWKELLAFTGVVLAAYFGYLGIRSQIEIPIQATQTAEAKLTLAAQTVINAVGSVISTPGATQAQSSLQTGTPAYSVEPEQFIRNYYDLINNREYDKAWAMLSPGFQRRNAPDGFDGYKQFWDGIKSVEVQNVQITEWEGIDVLVSVTLKYTAKFGTETPDIPIFRLTPDITRSSWLFDR